MIEQVFRVGSWSAHLASGAVVCSRGFRSLAGLDAVSLNAAALIAATHPDDRALMSVLMTDLSLVEEEYLVRVVRGDGSVRTLSCWTDTLRDAWDEPHTRICVSRDVTESRRKQARVRQVEAVLEAVLAANDMALWRMNPKGAVRDSPSWNALTGQTLEACQRHGWLHAVHPDDRPDLEAIWGSAFHAGDPVTREVRILDATGVTVPVRLVIVPVRDEAGQVVEWAGTAAPIREARRAEALIDADALTAAQLRACRGLLDWTVADLAQESGVSAATIARCEAPSGDLERIRPATRQKIRRTLEAHGVRFGGDGGVRLAA